MTNKTDLTNAEGLAASVETEPDASGTGDSGKEKFIEPELSSPVSVLEATHFFQGATSGVTT